MLLALLGAFISVDTTDLLQGMFHQPLAACTLVGAVLGRPLEGAYFGALLQLLSLGELPVGGALFRDVGTVAVGVTAGALMALGGGAAQLGFAGIVVVLLAMPLGWVGGLLVHRQREFQSRFLPKIVAAVEAGRPHILRRYLCLGIGYSAIRGAVTATAAALLTLLLLNLLGSMPIAGGVKPYALLAGMFGVGLGVLFELLDGRDAWAWVTAGVIVTAAGLLVV